MPRESLKAASFPSQAWPLTIFLMHELQNLEKLERMQCCHHLVAPASLPSTSSLHIPHIIITYHHHAPHVALASHLRLTASVSASRSRKHCPMPCP